MPDGVMTDGVMPDRVLAGQTPARVGRFDYRWVALGVVLCGTIMTILDSTIVNIAVPALQHAFKVGSYSDIAWVITGYLLAQGAVIPMTGWMTDRFGTKRLYLVTIALFTIASAACGLAQNLPELIGFRVLQGVGGGMLMPIGMTIILSAVGPQQMGRVMGIFGVPMLIAPAIGPVLGGWFVQDFSWRLIFYVNLPVGIIAFVLASRFLVETHRHDGLRLDYIGLLTATPAVVGIMYAVDRSNSLGWGSPMVVGILVGSAVLFGAFILRQLVAEQPLLHLRLFRDSTFASSAVLTSIVVTAMFGAMLLVPLYLQQVHHYDAIKTGLLLLPQALTAAVAMPLGGVLTDRFGPRPVVSFGLLILAGGSVVLAQLHADSPDSLIVGALALRGFAMGFAMMPTMSAAMARVPRQYTSRASSITNTLQRVGASVGIAVLVTILGGQFAAASQQVSCTPSSAVLAAGRGASQAQFCGTLRTQLAAAGANQNGPRPVTASPVVTSFVNSYANDVESVAFDRTFGFIAILSLVGLIPAFFLKRPDHHDESAIAGAVEMAA